MPRLTKTLLHWHLRTLAPVCLLTTAALANAQDIAAAEALFNKGKADMSAGKYETGCKAIAESHRIDPRPGTLFTLATCERQWGHIATAVSRYGDYIALYARMPVEKQADPIQAQRHKEATEQRAKLLPEVPELTLSLPKDAPAGTVVKRDGEVVAAAALGLSLPVDPGEHTLTIQTPDGTVRQQQITIARREKKQVTLELPAGPGGRRVAAYVLGGVGAAGLVAGGILGGLALGQKGTMDEHCGAAIGQSDKTACDPVGLDASGNAKSMALGSTIAFAAGGATLGTAVILFFTERKSSSQNAGPAPAAGARAWVSAGLISAGPTGAVLGASGAW